MRRHSIIARLGPNDTTHVALHMTDSVETEVRFNRRLWAVGLRSRPIDRSAIRSRNSTVGNRRRSCHSCGVRDRSGHSHLTYDGFSE